MPNPVFHFFHLFPDSMEDDIQEEVLSQFKERRLADPAADGGHGFGCLCRLGRDPHAGVSLSASQITASRAQVSNIMTLLKGRSGGIADLGSGDGRIVDLSTYKYVAVFLAPSVLSLLQKKLLAELPEESLIVAGRFLFPDWTARKVESEGVDRAWACHIQELRHHYQFQDKHEKTS